MYGVDRFQHEQGRRIIDYFCICIFNSFVGLARHCVQNVLSSFLHHLSEDVLCEIFSLMVLDNSPNSILDHIQKDSLQEASQKLIALTCTPMGPRGDLE